jgi:hypothetical protein
MTPPLSRKSDRVTVVSGIPICIQYRCKRLIMTPINPTVTRRKLETKP